MLFFVASKILAFLTSPLAWVALLQLSGLILIHGITQFPIRFGAFDLSNQQKLGIRLVTAAVLLLLFAGWQGPAQWALSQLETSYPSLSGMDQEPIQNSSGSLSVPGSTLSHSDKLNNENKKSLPFSLDSYYGVLVLGGALDPGRLWTRPGQIALNSAAERMTATVTLLQRHPHFRIIFTGGEGELFGVGPKEALRAQLFFESFSVPSDHVLYESDSRNTYENAILTAQLPEVDIHKPWLLVTSAFHMPRSMAVFKHAGWNVTAFPVDYRSPEAIDWTSFKLSGDEGGPFIWHLVLHEALGLIVYKFTGKL